MARTYKRDSRGRFSGGGGGGGGKSRPAPRQVQRGVNRLTRDNAGRITSVGGSGATARGGRIRTAAGNLRATVTSKAGMVSQGRLTGAPLKSTIGKTSKARLNMGLTRPGKPGQREAYNAARTQLRANKPAAAAPRAASARRKAVGKISEAKAGRIISRIDANRPGLRKATGSARKTANSIKTQRKATDFALAAGARARKQGKSISVNESLQRGVKNAAAKNASKPRGLKPRAIKANTANKPAATASRLGSRLNPAKKADRAATRKFEQAYERENRIRSSLFRGNKSLQTRQAIGKELDKASNLTQTMLMQRRGIRAQFPVQTKDRARRAVGSKPSGTISQNKDIRNVVNRREAFKRKVNRAGALSRPGDDKKARRTTQVRAKAMATYQGARRPEISDSTVGRFGQSRTSTAFRAPASRLAAPSRAARRQGKALALAQKPIRDQFGRRIGNPKKQQRSKKTGSRALSFYQNPKAAAQSVLRDRGNRGLSTKGFRKPRGMR